MRIILTLFAVMLVAAGAVGFNVLQYFNAFDRIENDFDGLCEPVVGLVGPEDLQIAPDGDTVFISSHDRRAHFAGRETRGGIYTLSLSNPLGAAWRDRSSGAPEDFLPHGIHYYEAEGVRRLFAVNMATNAVEIFDVGEGEALTHLESVTTPALTSPNDVFAVGPRTFYVTNDVAVGRDTDAGTLHALFRKPSGSVHYFDDGSWREVADGLRFANGVVASRDGAALYVAEATGFGVSVFARRANGALDFERFIDLNTSADNLNLDADGDIWIGAHPKPLDLLGHERDLSNPSPSEVVRLRVGASPAEDEIEIVFLDRGRTISGSTSAARSGDTLLIGALYEEKFLLCKLGATLPAF